MSHFFRRCFKCGANQATNPELRMHRFPALNRYKSNVNHLMSWAVFCHPEKDWSNLEALAAISKSCKVICSKHFEESEYTSEAKIRLHRHAVPTLHENNKENFQATAAASNVVGSRCVLGVHGQIMPEEPDPVKPLTTSKKENVQATAAVSNVVGSRCVLGVHGQIMPEEPDPVKPLTTSKKENVQATAAVSNVVESRCVLGVHGQIMPEEPNPVKPLTTSRKTSLKTNPVSKTKIYNKCKYLLKKINKLKMSLKQNKSIDILQMLHNNENVIELFKNKISPSMALLLQGEIENGQKKHRGRRWNQNQKFLALELYKKSPRAYRLLARLFCLPTPHTLKKLLGNFVLKPGINTSLYENLKKFSKKNSKSDNVCFLTFDEMSIRKNLNYNKKNDEIDGYQDHGRQGKSKVYASHALVFMLVWIRKRWKQPVAFYFSGDYVTADRLTVLIKEVLHECLKSGVQVCATVCDMDGVNVRALEHLGSTVEKPYFDFEGEEIVTLPDPPHLLKCFRNLFMTYDVKLPIPVQSTTMECATGTGVASWKHIEKFYELDNCNPNFVYAPKLSKRHLQPNGKEKMRVYLAAQIFSHSVATGIYSKASTNELPAGAVATAVFLEHMNNLFDLVNANAPDLQQGKPYKTNFRKGSPHKDYFKKSAELIGALEFVGCKRKPPSQSGWLKLLHGYERLWDNLNKNYNIMTIATRRINQDPLENCFGCIRANCGCNDNPTVAQFIAGLKTSITTNLRNFVSLQRNCEDDSDELVDNFKYLFTTNKSKIKSSSCPLSDSEPIPNAIEQDTFNLSDEDIEKMETSAELQACAYVCGFIFKAHSKHCKNCKMAMLADKATFIHNFCENKEYVDGKHSLTYANIHFIGAVEKSAEVVNTFLKDHSHTNDIKKKCMSLIRENVNFTFLDACSEHKAENIIMIEQSVTIILIKRFCLLENRKVSIESAKKSLAKKINILKNC